MAIVHPRFAVLGGAEKVVEELARLYADADIFVLYSLAEKVPDSLRDRNIYTTFLNRIPAIHSISDKVSVLYPIAVESMDLSSYDLILSSAGPATFGVNVSQHAMHICYCHSPERSWWDKYAYRQQQSHSRTNMLIYTMRASYLRAWEFGAAQRVDQFVACSRYIAERVQKYFRRESTVIYPPVNTSCGYLAPSPSDYYLSVGRLMPAKRIELLVQACNILGRRLLIAGTGREEKRLKALAGPTIEFLDYVPDADLPALYANCRAFLFAADEDFGIVPVEAQAYGRPVIAYGYGGSLETVRVGDPNRSDTGVFFAGQTVEQIVDAIKRFEGREHKFNPLQIQEHARQFDSSVFVKKMQELVDAELQAERGYLCKL